VADEEHLGGGAGSPQGAEQRAGVAVGDRLLADDRHPRPAGEGGGGPAEDARPHHDVVAAEAEVDGDRAFLSRAHSAVQPEATRTAVAARPTLAGSRTAPPPKAITANGSDSSARRTAAFSSARKAGSPSEAKISATVQPASSSTSLSVSTNWRPRRRATRRPTELFPTPI